MKKNRNFTVKNVLWPGLFLLTLFVAALASNVAVFRTQGGGAGASLLPNPAPPIQMSASGAPPLAALPEPLPEIVTPAPNAALSMQDGVNQVLARVLPAVVSVSKPSPPDTAQNTGGTAYITPYGGPAGSTGAGIIVDDRGYVLTTFQTVGKSDLVKIHLYAGTRRDYLADVVGVDPTCDLALLKIRGTRTLPAVPLADSDRVKVGDIVFAIGNPFGFSGSVTMGIVSSNNRKVNIGGVKYPDLIQLDAAINEGNDGGPLVNINGEVIGINMACLIPDHRFSGIGFAVPSNDAAPLLSGQVQ